MVTIKKGKKEVEFDEPACAECKKVIPLEEVKELVGRDKMRQIEENQMDVRVQQDPNMVKCECGALICLEASAPDYKQKDEAGNPLSKAAAEHMAQWRVRCSACSKVFCAECKRQPYHVGKTC